MIRLLSPTKIPRLHSWRCTRSLPYSGCSSPFSTSRLHSTRDARTCRRSDPLRILFCGSDQFSSAHLKALQSEHLANPDLIGSLDVVVRPGKPVGRGYHEVKHSPVEALAHELNLPLHLRDTFTGWEMPTYVNLIIAVSFGLFVPSRLLGQAQYGGLNVHPSLLPDLRGAAPLIHALLLRRKFTGVTLQTLSPKAFDHGMVLAQTPLSDPIRVPEDCSLPQLSEKVTPVATRMLIDGLRAGVHVPPLQDRGWHFLSRDEDGAESREVAQLGQLKDAPKIKTIDRQLLPPSSSADDYESWYLDAVTRQRVIGPLWFKARLSRNGIAQRVIVQEATSRPNGGLDSLPKLQRATGDLLDEARGRAGNVTFGTLPIICQDDATGLESERQLSFFVTEVHSSVFLFGNVEEIQKQIDSGAGTGPLHTGPIFELKTLKLEGRDIQPAKQVLERLRSQQWQPRHGSKVHVALVEPGDIAHHSEAQ